jgi:crooked neck
VAAAVAAVTKRMPRRIKRKRPLTAADGSALGGGMEEFYDYVFPEEAGAAPNLKLLEAAMRWKRQKMAAGGGGGGDSDGGGDGGGDAAAGGGAGSDADQERQQDGGDGDD